MVKHTYTEQLRSLPLDQLLNTVDRRQPEVRALAERLESLLPSDKAEWAGFSPSTPPTLLHMG